MTPLGIRNNNPLNIRKGKTPWVGETSSPTRGGREGSAFCRFTSIQYGWRAAFLLLKKYINVYGLRTVGQIIRRWAPPNENDTEAYINHVERLSGVGRDAEITFNSAELLLIAAAMCCVENGKEWNPHNNPEWLQNMMNGYKLAGGDIIYPP